MYTSKYRFLDFFGCIQSFDLQVNAFIFNSSIVGHTAVLESISSLYF